MAFYRKRITVGDRAVYLMVDGRSMHCVGSWGWHVRIGPAVQFKRGRSIESTTLGIKRQPRDEKCGSASDAKAAAEAWWASFATIAHGLIADAKQKP